MHLVCLAHVCIVRQVELFVYRYLHLIQIFCTRIIEMHKYNMNTIINKYNTWYWTLIETRKDQAASKLTERHHIVPRSLGGKDDNTNLVNLTLREHFIAHMLLARMLTGNDRAKMIFASRQMLSKYKPCSRTYETLKMNANKAMSEKWNDREWSTPIITARKKHLATPEGKKQRSDTAFELWADPEYRANHKSAMQSIQTDELSNDKSNKMKDVWQDEEKRNRILSSRKPHTDERKLAISKATSEQNKSTWADPIVRARRIDGLKKTLALKKAAKAASLLATSNSLGEDTAL